MVLTQDQIQVAQGALYMIDHIGPAPPNMDFRRFTDQAMTDHLKQHTYHYRPRNPTGPDSRSPVTLVWMRRWIRDLSAKAKPSFYQAESHTDDNADKLFRKGTTEGFPDNILRRYGYDRATFSEADLPGYTAQAEETEDDEDALEARAQQSGNIMEPQPNQASAGSFDHHTAGKSSGYEHDALQQPPNRPSIASGKRKHEDEDLGGSNGDNIVAQPSVRKKRKTPINLSTNSRHPQVVLGGDVTPMGASSQLELNTSNAQKADNMLGVQHASDVRSREEEAQDSHSPRPAVSSQDNEQQPQLEQQPQPPPFDIDGQGRDFERFYERIMMATDRVIRSIGKISNSLSCLDENPSERLEALYARCWGSDWAAVRVKLTEECFFTTPEVAMSVISAFLLISVFNQQASIQDIAKQLELKGAMGKAILRTLDLESGENELVKLARTIESEEACIKLTDGEKSGTLEQELHTEAEKLTKELWDIIVPHFRGLSQLARVYGVSSHRPEQDWCEVFEGEFTGIIAATLRKRLELLATGREHEYTWPEASASYDLGEMAIHGGFMESPQEVLWTVFPGIKVRLRGSDELGSYGGMKAKVKAKERPKKCTCGAYA